METPDASQNPIPLASSEPAHSATRTIGPPPGTVPPAGSTRSVSGDPVAPQPAAAAPSMKHWGFGSIGLGIGLVVGLGLGTLIVPFVSGVTAPLRSASVDMGKAVKACGLVSNEWIKVGDHGRSITMNSEGDETDGAGIGDVMCVLRKLDTPDSVLSEIGETRALDGRLSAKWDDLSASWSYHPDNGLDIVVRADHG